MNTQRRDCAPINEFRPSEVCVQLKTPLASLSAALVTLGLLAMSAQGQPTSFTNYGGYYRADPTGSKFSGYHHAGPWTWFPQANDPAPFWDSLVTFVDVATPAGEPQFSEDGIVSIPVTGTLTVNAHSPENPGEVIGTMLLTSAAPFNIVGDLNPAHATLDEQMGMIYTRWGSPLLPEGQPAATYVLEEETGVFAEDDFRLVGEQDMFYNAVLGLQLVEGLSIEETLQRAGPPTTVGGFGEWAWTGQYEIKTDGILGDVNRDGALGAEDVDLVSHEVWNGGDLSRDLNSDGTVSRSDVDYVLELTNRLNGDADFDGEVQFSDFLILSGNFGQSDATWSRGDFDSNGLVGFPDFLILSGNFGESVPMAAAVPEPSCLLLAIPGLVGIFVRRRMICVMNPGGKC